MAYEKVRPKRQPSGCVQETPTLQSISFAGRWINLSAISRSQGIDKSYLSRIFSGERPNPTISYIKKISAAIGMTPDEVMIALDERHDLIKKGNTNTEIQHLTRIIQEDEADLKRLNAGKPVAPRATAERLPSYKLR